MDLPDTPMTRDGLVALLRERSITPTHQRVEIAQAMLGGREHLSADRVLARVNLRHPETSRATVYNTLNLFAERGLLRQVIVDPQRVFFDSNVSPHFHFYDVESGELIDVDADALSISRLPALPEGMVSEGMDLIIRIRPQGDTRRPRSPG